MTHLIALLLGLAATTAPADPPTYRCRSATAPVVIDGKPDDAAWSRAAWTADFSDILGHDRPAPPLRTRAKLLWDEKCLYLAVEMQEPDVRGEMVQRDDPLYRENAFELFLDPDDDGREYLELEINARGTIFDLVMSRPYSERGRKREAFTIEGMKSAVHVNGTLNDPSDRDRGWTIELAIPWAALKELSPDAVPPKAGARMRMNLARTHFERAEGAGKGKVYAWSPLGEMNLHAPRRWGYLELVKSSE